MTANPFDDARVRDLYFYALDVLGAHEVDESQRPGGNPMTAYRWNRLEDAIRALRPALEDHARERAPKG